MLCSRKISQVVRTLLCSTELVEDLFLNLHPKIIATKAECVKCHRSSKGQAPYSSMLETRSKSRNDEIPRAIIRTKFSPRHRKINPAAQELTTKSSNSNIYLFNSQLDFILQKISVRERRRHWTSTHAKTYHIFKLNLVTRLNHSYVFVGVHQLRVYGTTWCLRCLCWRHVTVDYIVRVNLPLLRGVWCR